MYGGFVLVDAHLMHERTWESPVGGDPCHPWLVTMAELAERRYSAGSDHLVDPAKFTRVGLA